jgi:hypothetical protein
MVQHPGRRVGAIQRARSDGRLQHRLRVVTGQLGRAQQPFQRPERLVDGQQGALDPNDPLAMAWKWQRGDVARHTGGDLEAALARITAKTFVMPIDEDMFFPVRNCRAGQEMIKGSGLRVVNDVLGHLGLFGVAPTLMPPIDQYLGELLATDV